MRIENITSSHKFGKTAFGYSIRMVYTPENKFKYKTTTLFFREDLWWNSLMNYLKQQYKKVPSIRTINHACSDGEETFSFAAKLICDLKDQAEKYFPIIARDIDEDNIETAKKGIYRIRDFELNNIVENTGDKFDEFFELRDIKNFDYEYAKNTDKLLIVKDSLKEKVIFQQSDIVKDFRETTEPMENTLLICRNFWPYLKTDDAKELLANLSKKLKPPSTSIYGGFDVGFEISYKLRCCGFRQLGLPYVMQKYI